MAIREAIKTVKGVRQIDGAGVHLVRVIGHQDVKQFDPFLMLDAFDSYDPKDYIKGFPWHPHRGMETVTYLIKGELEHQDSLGNKGVIHSGECQWMTAGSGILHQEMPKASDHLLGFQLWINLPRKDKMTAPHYFEIRSDMVTTVVEPNATVRIISGAYKDKKGVKGRHVDALLLDVTLLPNESFRLPVDKERNLFIYIFEGTGYAGTDSQVLLHSHTAVLFDHAEEFLVRASDKGMRFALFAGKPLEEPIAWGGPIVMNTEEELDEAFHELNIGTFIR